MTHRLSRALLASALALALAVRADHVLAQATVAISGKVVSDAGNPVAGVTISVDLPRSAAASREDGTYILPVASTRRGTVAVTARRIGFKAVTQTITLTGSPITLDFKMDAQATLLTGIEVTALSVQREKTTIGTSQQSISTEALTRTQTPNVIQNMSGKVSGVVIQQSGNIGGSARIVIRGQGSLLGNNQPLFIVDGIPISNAGFSTASAGSGRDYGNALGDLTADNIASMTVLKGPNAAAIYGSRASNGAVVINTKTGKGGLEGTRITFNSYMTNDQFSIFPKYQNGYGQGFGGEFNYVDGAGSGVNDGADESWGPKLDGRTHGCVMVPGTPAYTTNYDQSVGCDQFNGKALPWIAHPNNVRDYFQNGASISNNVNVTASARNLGTRLSITKDEVNGIVPFSKVQKLNATMTGNATINEKLNVSGTLTYVQNSGNRPENGYTEGNPFMTFTWFGRQVDVAALKDHFYNKNNVYGLPDGSLFNWNDNYHRNPYWQMAANPAPDNRERVIAQMTGKYQFASWLSGTLRGGRDTYRQVNIQDFAKGNIDNASASYNGGFTNTNNHAVESNMEGLLQANHQFFGHLDVTGNLGGNRRRNDADGVGYNTNGILVPGIYNLSNAGVTATVSNTETHSAVNSAYGSGILTWNRYWTVEVTGRNDWSSTLPKKNASYFYSSVSSSLVLSDLFPSITKGGILTYAKVRGSYAKVGADAGAYALATLYSGSSNKFGGLPLFSLNNTTANAFLKPEQTYGKEGGVELSFLEDKFTLDATYYNKETRDQIMNLTVAPATGFSSASINAGQMSNKGYEALLTARVLRLKNGFQWNATFNYTKNNNTVDKLYEGLSTIVLGSNWGANIEARQGQPYGVIFGYGWLRDTVSTSATKGQLLLSGGLPQRDGVKKILGNVNPKWVGGFGSDFRYKNYSMNILFDMRVGGQNFSSGNWWGMYAGILQSTLKGREVDWNKPGLVVQGVDVATGKANTINVTAEDYGHNLYPTNEPAILNTGFVKLRELRFGWEVPNKLASKFRLQAANLALVGRNLWTKTDFPNYDPENLTNTSNVGQGFDMGALPTTRSLGFNISITP